MKKNYTLICPFLLVLAANAQPVLTTLNTNAIGDSIQRIGIDTIKDAATIGSAGANVTWNFTNVDSINTGKTFYVLPSSTTYSATGFAKKANIASYAIGATYNSYQFYNSQPGYFVIVGAAGGPVDSMIYPSLYDTVVYFPFTYQSAIDDSSITNTHLLGYVNRGYAGRHSYVDGYGTLNLPNATYNNVIRYHNEFFMKDSLYQGTTYMGQTHTYYIKEYFWASQDYRGSLMYMEKIYIKDGVLQKQGPFWYSKSPIPVGATAVNNYTAENTIDIFPNPSNGVFTIQSSEKMSKIEIINILGEKIYSASVNCDKAEIDLSDHANGIYFYSLSNENKIIGTGKLIIE